MRENCVREFEEWPPHSSSGAHGKRCILHHDYLLTCRPVCGCVNTCMPADLFIPWCLLSLLTVKYSIFCFICFVVKYITFTIFTIFKRPVLWPRVHSHCHAPIITTRSPQAFSTSLKKCWLLLLD